MRGHRRFVYTYRKVHQRAVEDGRDWRWRFWPPKWPFREPKESQPASSQSEHALFEMALKEAAENDLEILAEEWQRRDLELKPPFCEALAEHLHAETALTKETSEAQAAAEEFKAAETSFHELRPPALRPGWMYFWLIVIGLCEFPLNSIVFQIFGQEQMETWLVSAGLGVTIPLMADWFGRSLKQSVRSAADRMLMLVAPVVVLALLTTLAFLREKFFEASEAFRLLGLRIAPGQAVAVFIAINIALFFVATIIAYEGSPDDRPLYIIRHRRWKEARRLFHKEMSEAQAAAHRLERAAKMLQRSRTMREKIFERFSSQASYVKENADSYVAIYRSVNLSARRSAECPPCFRLPPPAAAIPASLLTIDWNCAGVPSAKEATTESKGEA